MGRIAKPLPIRGLWSLARRRVRGRVWPIVQTAFAAMAAWFLASLLVSEPHPAFASIAAVISLGATFGERRQKAVQLVAGVVLGIAIADLLVGAIGPGVATIGLLVLLAMLAAVLLGGGELLVSEAAVSAVLLASLAPSAAGTRLTEALVGGGVALAVHFLVFPPDPVLAVARAANVVLGGLGSVLRDAAVALEEGDTRRAEQALQGARDADADLRDLQEALVLGHQTARWAPAHRRTAGELARYERTIEHVDLVNRETRVLVRDVARFVRSGRAAPAALVESVHDLARSLWELPAQFDEPWRSGDVLVLALGAAGRAAAAAEAGDAAVGQVAGHVRSVAIDVVRASEAVDAAGGPIAEARTDEYVALPPRSPREPPPAGGERDLAANG